MADIETDLTFLRASPLGDDPALLAELQSAFADSVGRQIDLLSRARCDGNWRVAAARLEGLAASFGVDYLDRLAKEASRAAPGDPVAVSQLKEYHATLLSSLSS